MSFISQTEMGRNGNSLLTGWEWELNLRHHGNAIGNELMGTGGNRNVASHSRTSLVYCIFCGYFFWFLICVFSVPAKPKDWLGRASLK